MTNPFSSEAHFGLLSLHTIFRNNKLQRLSIPYVSLIAQSNELQSSCGMIDIPHFYFDVQVNAFEQLKRLSVTLFVAQIANTLLNFWKFRR